MSLAKLDNYNLILNWRKYMSEKIDTNVIVTSQFTDKMITFPEKTRKKHNTCGIIVLPVTKDTATSLVKTANGNLKSFVRPAFAGVVGVDLDHTLEANNENYHMMDTNNTDVILVAQYSGARLSSKDTQIPDDSSINYRVVMTDKTWKNVKASETIPGL